MQDLYYQPHRSDRSDRSTVRAWATTSMHLMVPVIRPEDRWCCGLPQRLDKELGEKGGVCIDTYIHICVCIDMNKHL